MKLPAGVAPARVGAVGGLLTPRAFGHFTGQTLLKILGLRAQALELILVGLRRGQVGLHILGTTAPLVVGALPTNLNLTRLPRRRLPPESFPRDVDPLAHGGPDVATRDGHTYCTETTLSRCLDY